MVGVGRGALTGRARRPPVALRRHWGFAVLLVLAGCFLIPVGAYLGWFGASHPEPGFTTFSGAFLYGG